MLIEFRVSNFKSIRKEQLFSLYTEHVGDELPDNIFFPNKDKQGLAKSAVIYGSNASGKSNLLEALECLVDLMVKSASLKAGDKIPHYSPYKLSPDTLTQPVSFAVEFYFSDKARYEYTVSFDSKNILSEELYFFPKKQRSLLYSRHAGFPIKFGTALGGRKKTIESELLTNQLFFSKAANSNHDILNPLYLYFRRQFEFQGDFKPETDGKSSTTLRIIEDSESNYAEKVSRFLRAADLGIESVNVEKMDLGQIQVDHLPKHYVNELKYKPYLMHKSSNDEPVRFEIEEESLGTKKMYKLAGRIIDTLESGGVFVADELDSSMHPDMLKYIVELFHDSESNPQNAQLIFSTHDAHILNAKIFRRDQVWFVSKSKGETQLFSLDEFDKNEVRKNGSFGTWYLEGRFGAVPHIRKHEFLINSSK